MRRVAWALPLIVTSLVLTGCGREQADRERGQSTGTIEDSGGPRSADEGDERSYEDTGEAGESFQERGPQPPAASPLNPEAERPEGLASPAAPGVSGRGADQSPGPMPSLFHGPIGETEPGDDGR